MQRILSHIPMRKQLFFAAMVIICLMGCAKQAEVSYDNRQTCRQMVDAHLNDLPLDSLMEQVMTYRTTLTAEQQKAFDSEFVETLAEEAMNQTSLIAKKQIEMAGDVNAVIVSEMIKEQLSLAEEIPEYYRAPYSIACYKHIKRFEQEFLQAYLEEEETPMPQSSPMTLFIKVDSQDLIYISEDDEDYRPLTLDELDRYMCEMPSDEQMQVSLCASKEVSMGIVTEIKQILRKYRAMKITYRTC